MDSDRTEACGRCGLSSVVDSTDDGDGDGERAGPFDGDRIEVAEADLRVVARPLVWAGRVKRRLDAVATRLTYGR